MKRLNKYYVGATHIGEAVGRGDNDSHTHATLESAIEAAKEKLENEDCEATIVVQIIRVIRRKSQPVVVEVVR